MSEIKLRTATAGRTRLMITLEAELLDALTTMAQDDGRDRSHEIEALIRAEVKRRKKEVAK